MAYTTRPGTEIKDYWPDDTDTEMYIPSSGESLGELLDRAREKWPEASLDNITIHAENIHTHCLTYDLHDSSDYTNFIVITYQA